MSPPTHSIRLRGPWQYAVLARFVVDNQGAVIETDQDLPNSGTLVMPADWGGTLGGDFHGRVRYTRHFGHPTGLTENDEIVLVIERVDALGHVSLNHQLLGEIPAHGEVSSFPIRALLQPRNRLDIEVALPCPALGSPPISRPGREGMPGGLVGEVRLEIGSAQAKIP